MSDWHPYRDAHMWRKEEAFYSDETEMFVSPMEPKCGDEVTIRFRVYSQSIYALFVISGGNRWKMEWEQTKNGYDYYFIRITMQEKSFRYFFEIQFDNRTLYYNRLGISNDLQETNSFEIIPGFSVPDWAKGAVFYQIYVDRFANGDTSNDVESDEYCYINEHVKRIKDWHAKPSSMDVRNFYGGDLQGVLNKLDYLQELGVEVLYLNPVFVSPSNHKYDSQDYDYVDPHFGRIVYQEEGKLQEDDFDNSHARRYISRVTDMRNLEASNELLRELIEEAHKRDMKVILDGVFNHCGSFHKWMDRERIYENEAGYEKGAYVDENSPYRYYFHFQNQFGWPYNEYYDGWWNHNTLPKLNYEGSKELCNDILRIAKKWVSAPYNADGWRLDVAADLGKTPEFNHYFWKEFRKAVKEANPEAFILAEHYGEPKAWLGGDEWDSVMNYDAFMEPVTWFLTGMEKHSDCYREDMLGNARSFCDAMRYHMASFPMPSLFSAMNELDNHDHSRFLTRTNHKAGRVHDLGSEAAEQDVRTDVLREAVVMQMTWPGAPTLYYGNEVGVCGFTDPDSRRTYPWGKEDAEILDFYKAALRMHKRFPMLRKASVKLLSQDYNLLVYGRFTEDEFMIVIVNNSDSPQQVNVSAWLIGVPDDAEGLLMKEVFSTDQTGYAEDICEHMLVGGECTVQMAATSTKVLYLKF